MTLEDLERTLGAAIATGRIGRPVSLTLHIQLAAETDLADGLATLLPLAEGLFDSAPVSLAASERADGPQWNLLIRYPRGETAVVTVGRGSTSANHLRLLVLGSEGVIRLEGDDPIDVPPAHDEDEISRCRSLVASALASRASISC